MKSKKVAYDVPSSLGIYVIKVNIVTRDNPKSCCYWDLCFEPP